MKVIHWTPKENKESILQNGLQIQDTRIAYSILTPFDNLNRWWLDFSLLETGKEYIGFIFELNTSDFPLVHHHWCASTYQELGDNLEITLNRRYRLDEILKDNPNGVYSTKDELKKGYKETILFRIGETTDEVEDVYELDYERVEELGYDIIKKDNEKAFQDFFDDPDFMEFTFEDYQVLLFNDISPERLETIIQPEDSYCYTTLLDEVKTSLFGV